MTLTKREAHLIARALEVEASAKARIAATTNDKGLAELMKGMVKEYMDICEKVYELAEPNC